jgi:hypothetical protein
MFVNLLSLLLACLSDPDPVRVAQPEHGQGSPADSGDGGGSSDTDTDEGDSDTSDSEEAEMHSVALITPLDEAWVENPVTFTVQASSDIALVSLEADGWSLGEAWDPTQDAALTYSFSGTGYSRLITLSGYDSAGNLVADDSITITVEASSSGMEMPYYYQYDNLYEPGSTCGLTSTAMVLSYWTQGTVTPDELYLEYGKAQGQSPSGITELYEWHGLYGRSTTTGTREQIREHLDSGRTIIVHGYWTNAGHIIVIVAHDSNGWIVNDPAGDWFSCYNCGVSGEGVAFPYGSAADDALSDDGDIWFSVADTSSF